MVAAPNIDPGPVNIGDDGDGGCFLWVTFTFSERWVPRCFWVVKECIFSCWVIVILVYCKPYLLEMMLNHGEWNEDWVRDIYLMHCFRERPASNLSRLIRGSSHPGVQQPRGKLPCIIRTFIRRGGGSSTSSRVLGWQWMVDYAWDAIHMLLV